MKNTILCNLASCITLAFCLIASASAQTEEKENAPVSSGPLSDWLTVASYSAPAQVKALNTTILSSENTGKVTRISKTVGARVKKDELLVELDCRVYQAELGAQKANLAQLKAQQTFAARQLQRAEDLKSKKSLSHETLEKRAQELNVINARITEQKQRIRVTELARSKCQINAPFDGVVIERIASEGDLANPGSPLIKVLQQDKLEVSAQLTEQEIALLHNGSNIHFSYNKSSYPLKQKYDLPLVNEKTRTRELRLDFIDEKTAPTGANGRLVWSNGNNKISSELLVRRNNQLGIFVLENNIAKFHVLPEATEGQAANTSLAGSTLVVNDGRENLSDGQQVTIK